MTHDLKQFARYSGQSWYLLLGKAIVQLSCLFPGSWAAVTFSPTQDIQFVNTHGILGDRKERVVSVLLAASYHH